MERWNEEIRTMKPLIVVSVDLKVKDITAHRAASQKSSGNNWWGQLVLEPGTNCAQQATIIHHVLHKAIMRASFC